MRNLVVAVAALVAVWAATPSRAAEPTIYEGARVCAKCHDLQGESWQSTGHAKAFDLLKPQARADAKVRAKFDPAKDYS